MRFDPQETFPKFGLGTLLAQSRMAGIAYFGPSTMGSYALKPMTAAEFKADVAARVS
jgi:hypothetical protein